MDKCIYCICFALLLSGCATQKSKSDQSGFSRFYHNQTSRFNGYFNANELLEESIAILNESHQDNYNEILEVYPYRAAPNAEGVSPQLDEAIKKVSIVATIHDNSDYVDDCYLLIAKAEYLKKDYESAQGALEFFMDEFDVDGKRFSNKSSRGSKSRSKKKADAKKSKREREKSSKQRAKEAERARKKYNKALKKQKKRASKGKATQDVTPPSRRDSDNIVASKRNAPPAKLENSRKEREEEEARRKAEQAQDPGGIKHRPAHQEAELWLARTYVERDNYPRAEYYFSSLRANPYLQEEVRSELPAAQAEYAIRRGNYAQAIPLLEEAIEVTRNRQMRARYAYILAQITEMNESTVSLAYEKYKSVLGYNPRYELEFNTRLSMARTAYRSGAASLAEAVRMLEKMLKDDKNVEYLDKIYFTFARVELLNNNTNNAIAYLQQAVAAGGQNQAQQTENNYLLAELYFEQGMYVEAKSAYDATLQTMVETDDRYERTKLLSENLTSIAQHLQTITLQDSLLRIGRMSEAEKKAVARKIADAEQSAALASSRMDAQPKAAGKKGAAANNQLVTANPGSSIPMATPVLTGSAQSSFFAYDQRNVRRGEREFSRVWGNRPLADNWRVMSNIGAADEIADDGTIIAIKKTYTDDELLALLGDVPETEEEIAAAEGQIQEAMLRLGSLYREKLERTDLSISVLEDLVSRYPEAPQKLEAYYQLYLSYLSVNNAARADHYKNLIVKEYPTSKFAMALTDPDYINRELSKEEVLENHYNEIYALVDAGEYDQAMQLITSGKASFGARHAFQGRIAILEAMCIGNKEGKDAYVTALRDIVAQFPNTPEETKARDMLLLLGEYKGDRLKLEKGTTAKAGFRVQPKSVHYMLVMIENFNEVTTQEAKLSISDFNRKYFKLDRLKISSLVFDPKTKQYVILVRSFKDSGEAMKYLDIIRKNQAEFLPEKALFEAYPVSQFNYREVVKQRSIESYRDFFDENYSD